MIWPVTFSLLLAAVPMQAAPQQTASGTASGLAEDRAKLRAYLDGQAVGSEEFSVARQGSEWLCRGTTSLKIPGGGTEEVTATLRLGADGFPVAYQWSTKGQKKTSGAVQFQSGSARIDTATEGGAPFTQEFQFDSPRIVVLDNNLYHHYAVLARLYDWNAKGAQTFSVLIPQDLTPGTITVEWAGPQELDGQQYDTLRVRSEDLTIELYVAAGKLVRLRVPDSKAEVRRE
jgi:hypothetical protein